LKGEPGGVGASVWQDIFVSRREINNKFVAGAALCVFVKRTMPKKPLARDDKKRAAALCPTPTQAAAILPGRRLRASIKRACPAFEGGREARDVTTFLYRVGD